MKRIGSENLRNHLRFFIIGTVFSIEPSNFFEFCKPSLNNMQTFYETNFYFYKRGKTKRHPLTKIITDVVYKEKNRGGNVNKMTVYVKMFTAFGSEQSVSAA